MHINRSSSPLSSIQLGYRSMKIAPDYISRGTTQHLASLAATLRVRKQMELKGFMQYESWLVPVLNTQRQRDFMVSLQLTWFPHLVLQR